MKDEEKKTERPRPSAPTARAQAETEQPPAPSGPSAPTLALPKGGGALRGIGEKFVANAQSGTASLTAPIAISPGRAGFQPTLALGYDSGAGNGPFGIGWSLSIPSIARKTDKGLPRYHDGAASDTFILAGAEDLVPALVPSGNDWALDAFDSGDYRVQRYRPRVESAFARIERWTHRTTGDAFWKTTSRENVVSTFGASAASRIADPEDPRRVFRWLLDETRDDRGQIISYEYKAEDAANVDRGLAHESNRLRNGAFANRYPKRIRYGNGAPGQASDWRFEVVFDYGEHDALAPTVDESAPWPVRADPFSSYRAAFEVRTYRLCRRVLMFHRFTELGENPLLVRSTDFTHDEDPIASLLVGVTQKGYLPVDNGYQSAATPTLALDYTAARVDPIVHAVEPASAEHLPGQDRGGYQWVDLDGEGMAGLLAMHEGAWTYKRNLGGGSLAPIEVVSERPMLAASGALGAGGLQLLDLAGDGRRSLVNFSGPTPGYQDRVVDEVAAPGWGRFTPFSSLPRVSLRDPNARLIDADGDGLTDLLVSEDAVFRCYQSRGKDGFTLGDAWPRERDEDKGPALLFADAGESIYLADMAGDGLADIVRIRNGSVCYWPNLGYGRFGAKVTMSGAPLFDHPEAFRQSRIRIGDIDGSGTADLVYLRGGRATLWMNRAGNSFSPPIELPSGPSSDALDGAALFDLLGNGTACLVWSSPRATASGEPLRYLDLASSTKPHLLSTLRNNLGAETVVSYAPSTRFYVDDRRAGRPWATRLPFPVQVVERVEHHDLVADTTLVTRFAYHHGFYDGAEREFRGFGMVEQWDTESLGDLVGKDILPLDTTAQQELYVPPAHTKTWFHTGAFIDGRTVSKHLSHEYWPLDANALHLADSILPPDITGAERREALRALRGHPLREELFADDGSDDAGKPYRVAEHRYEVRRIQPLRGQRYSVFFPHPLETIEQAYERTLDDPRSHHQLTLAVDDFGSVTQAATVAYPRRQPAEPEQGRTLILYKEASFVNHADDPAWFRAGVPVEQRTWELTGVAAPGGLYTVTGLLYAASHAAEIEYQADPTPNTLQKRQVERARTLYIKDDLSVPLALGVIESKALPYEIYRLALTASLASDVFGSHLEAQTLATTLTSDGKYTVIDGDYWIPSGRAVFDPSAFYQATAYLDPFGQQTSVTLDAYQLLPVQTTDPLSNTNQATHDYRVLQPSLVTDPNANRSAARYDALGMVVATALMGKDGAGEGDTLDAPTVAIDYDLFHFGNTGRPNFLHAKARILHGQANIGFQESYSYSDGFGRELMKKVQAEAGLAPTRDGNGNGVLIRDQNGALVVAEVEDRWVGTGRTVFNNKGNPVKKYEPFFSSTHEYEDEQDLVQWGVTPILHYDPVGRVIRTDQPNGTFSTVALDAWTVTTSDENDTVGESAWYAARQNLPQNDPEGRAAALAYAHRQTPTVARLDPLGRTFLTIADNGGGATFTTRLALDIESNTRTVTDALGHTALAQTFDVAGRPVHANSADAGESWLLPDVAGKPLRTWDGRGVAVRRLYDALRRPTDTFAAVGQGAEALVERAVYGEPAPNAVTHNLRTRLWKQLDGAGTVVVADYDFKGNLLSSSRQVAGAYSATIDWQNPPSDYLSPFSTATAFDALNRPTLVTLPNNNQIRPSYNRAALLERIEVAPLGGGFSDCVSNIDYDAKGRREKIQYGNSVETDYTYDPLSFRLTRILSTRPNNPNPLQDLSYTYDPVGNIVQIGDAAQSTIFFNNFVVSPTATYTYDPLYRLTQATGREHIGQTGSIVRPTDVDTWLVNNLPEPNDPQAMRLYTESYAYDGVGNILSVSHASGNNGWSRRYQYAANSNRLSATTDDNDQFNLTYTHDPSGNMTAMPHLPSIDWDHANRMTHADRGGGGDVYFTYDAAGQRIRKVVIDQNGNLQSERIYFGPYETYREYTAGNLSLERESLHVLDDQRRVALIETKTYDQGAINQPTSLPRYQLDNHLGSACLELDGQASVITYEEYHPYGTTAYRSMANGAAVAAKRYRYTGKERDEETGLFYHGARYYASWLARWTSCDPVGLDGGINLYAYVRGNPVARNDPSGTHEKPASARPPDPIQQLGPEGYHPPPPSARTPFQREMDTAKGPATNEAGLTPKQQDELVQRLVKDVGPDSPLGFFVKWVVPIAIIAVTFLVSLPFLASAGVFSAIAGAAKSAFLIAATNPFKLYTAASFTKGLLEDYPGQLGPDLPDPGDDAGRATRAAAKELIRDVEAKLAPAAEQALKQEAPTLSSKVLIRSQKQLQAKFKHAPDFGVVGNYNKAKSTEFSRAIHQHINSPDVQAIQGTYRKLPNVPITHYVHPTTGLNVMADAAGNFISAWKLSAGQLWHVLTHGGL